MIAGAVITAAQLQRFAPSCDFLALGPALDTAARRHGITTPRRVRHFMAHLHVEAQGLTRLEENLNYSAARLMVVWPKRFPTLQVAQAFAYSPRDLSEKVYGGRMGNVAPGDGWRYRGSGLIMLTGLNNFRRAEGWSGLPLPAQPDLARTAKAAAEIAAAFWEAEGLNTIVDVDAGEVAIADVAKRLQLNEGDDLREGTLEINGGLIGLEARARQLLRAAAVWPD